MEIILYSKPECHLCLDAKDKLQLVCDALDLTYKEIDIYSDDALLEKYQLMIPVIEVDGEIADFGKVTLSKIKKAIEMKV